MSAQDHDLGASLFRLGKEVLDAETPLLDRHGLTMWEYAVLTALQDGPAASQSELAVAVGRDKTRLIPILDQLGRSGYVERTPDPEDRRNRVVAVTPLGEETWRRAHASIREMEARLLARLPAEDRAAFVAALERLAAW